jgi:hypothetical protein
MLIQSAAAVPVRDDRGPGSACAKAVGTSTGPGVGTSVTARTSNASVRSAAGRRRGGRPDGAKTMRSEFSMPRRSARAVSVPRLRRKHRRTRRLRRRVVTQQKFFCRLLRATGRGAMNQPQSWAATRHATVALPAARRLAGCWIANASGFCVALSKAAANAPRSIKPPARGALDSKPT